MEKMVWAFEFAVRSMLCHICMSGGGWSDDGEKGVAKLFIQFMPTEFAGPI